MISSITSFVSSSSEISTDRSRRTHSRSCRTQVQGFDQSSRMTIRVSGTDWGVRRGLRRGAKEGEGSERRYAETRARVSVRAWSVQMSNQSTRSLEHELKSKIKTSYLPDPHPEHPDTYTPAQTGSRWGVLSPSFSDSPVWDLKGPQRAFPETPSGSPVFLLKPRY